MVKTAHALGITVVLAAASGWLGWIAGERHGLEQGLQNGSAVKTGAVSSRMSVPGGLGQDRNAGPAEPGSGGDAPLPAADSPLFADKVRAVFADPFTNRRLARLQLLLEQCGPAQFAAMVPLIRENDLRGMGSGKEWELIMQNWARKDGGGVMDFIRNYDWTGWHPLSGPGAKYEALAGWATKDPQAALAYFENPANGMTEDTNLQRALIQGWVAKDPEETARWLLSSGMETVHGEAFQLVVDAMCRKGGQDLLDTWFASLPKDSPALASMARAVTTAKNRYEPEKAAEWIESQKGQPWVEDGDLVRGTATQLAAKDPAAAMAWAGRTGSEAAVAAAMSSWCARDVGAASQWLQANASAPQYDQAAWQLIRTISKEDPEAARAWIGTLHDETFRQKALASISRRAQP